METSMALLDRKSIEALLDEVQEGAEEGLLTYGDMLAATKLADHRMLDMGFSLRGLSHEPLAPECVLYVEPTGGEFSEKFAAHRHTQVTLRWTEDGGWQVTEVIRTFSSMSNNLHFVESLNLYVNQKPTLAESHLRHLATRCMRAVGIRDCWFN